MTTPMIPNEQIHFLSGGAFNHCSCVCPSRSGMLIAWYCGTNECYNDQTVSIALIFNNGFTNQITLHQLTGNPIIWEENDNYWVLYSQFEENKNIKKLSDRWKSCNLFIQKIDVSDTIKLVGPPIKMADAKQSLLARCRPIIIDGMTYIPLYDEVTRCCVLFSGRNGIFKEYLRFGNGIIQPTIWTRPESDSIHTLCRNFMNGEKHSQYYCLDNICNGLFSGFLNINNSIHVAKWDKYGNEIVLWNDCDTPKRTKLTLGEIKWSYGVPTPIRIAVVGNYGSYPSLACTDNSLHFTFTNADGEIEHHEWNRKKYEREYSRRNN